MYQHTSTKIDQQQQQSRLILYVPQQAPTAGQQHLLECYVVYIMYHTSMICARSLVQQARIITGGRSSGSKSKRHQ